MPAPETAGAVAIDLMPIHADVSQHRIVEAREEMPVPAALVPDHEPADHEDERTGERRRTAPGLFETGLFEKVCARDAAPGGAFGCDGRHWLFLRHGGPILARAGTRSNYLAGNLEGADFLAPSGPPNYAARHSSLNQCGGQA
jgi:hypothetical protein